MSTATVEAPTAPERAPTVSPAIINAINNGSPFGPLPVNYPHLALLCKKGFVRCNDERTKNPVKLKGGALDIDAEGKIRYEETVFRNWSVVSEPSNGHIKFCMILDFLEHRAMRNMFQAKITPKVDRMNLIAVAIGVEKRVKLSDGSLMEIDVSRLERMSWRAIKAYLAKEGVKGYMVAHGSKSDDTELIADAFENGDVHKPSFL